MPKIRLAIVKIASRCNLNCTYCYMYNMGDDTYKSQPKRMSKQTIDQLLIKVKRHCLTHDLDNFTFIIHGGEPLLAGMKLLSYFVEEARKVLAPEVRVAFALQTNGMLLDDSWGEFFTALKVPIAISLDGPQEANDRYRIDHQGRGSYDRIMKGMETVRKYPCFRGIIAVVNLDSTPEEFYNFYKSFNIETLEVLLPGGHYDNLPAGLDPHNPNGTAYGDWMIGLFDLWFHDKGKKPKIRRFNYYMRLILGQDIHMDDMGTTDNEVIVIETDGGIEAVDFLKICGNGFTKEGANVNTHELDQALTAKLISLYVKSNNKDLCEKCSQCHIKEICGGGWLPERYRQTNGFDNPTIYCNDILKLTKHIYNQINAVLPERLKMADIMEEYK